MASNSRTNGEILYSNLKGHGLKYNFDSSTSDGKTTSNYYISSGNTPSKDLPSALSNLKAASCPGKNTVILIKSETFNKGEIKAWGNLANHVSTKIFDSCGSYLATVSSLEEVSSLNLDATNNQYSSESLFCILSTKNPTELALSIHLWESVDSNHQAHFSTKSLKNVFDFVPNLSWCQSGNQVNTLYNEDGTIVAIFRNNDSDSITYKDILTPEIQGSITVLAQCE